MLQPNPEIEHIGSATSTDGVISIDVKSARGIIARSDVFRLLDRNENVIVYNAEDLIRHIGEPREIGHAWISHSGRAVMYLIDGIRYISPLSQVRGIVEGERKTANVSFIWWRNSPAGDVRAVVAVSA